LTGATPNNLIYISGEPDHKVSNQDFVDHLESVIRDRAQALEVERSEREANIISSTH
jgi:(E)-4-hydroxy-3-methylbut-2-enyl-diphosphate synthase